MSISKPLFPKYAGATTPSATGGVAPGSAGVTEACNVSNNVSLLGFVAM